MFEGKDLENLAAPLESENKEEKEKMIMDRIDDISFAFSAEKYKQLKEKNTELKFSEILQRYSTLFFDLSRKSYKVNGGEKEEMEKYIDLLKNKIDKISSSSDNLAAINHYLKEESKKLDLNNKNENNQSQKEDENWGLTSYHLEAGEGTKYENIFKKIGLNKNDEAVSVHIKEGYKNGGQLNFKDGYKELSLKIKNDQPYVKAVIGQSWLMSSPIADKLGFKKIDDIDIPENGYDTWMQFMDKDGQVNKKRFEKLMQTSEFPYKVSAGYMMTEDFLKKYLPESERGEIILKEINNEELKNINIIKDEFKKLRIDWDNIASKDDLEKYLRENCSKIFEYTEKFTEVENFHQMLLKFKEENPTLNELKKKPEFIESGMAFDNFLKKIKYKDKKVVI